MTIESIAKPLLEAEQARMRTANRLARQDTQDNQNRLLSVFAERFPTLLPHLAESGIQVCAWLSEPSPVQHRDQLFGGIIFFRNSQCCFIELIDDGRWRHGSNRGFAHWPQDDLVLYLYRHLHGSQVHVEDVA